MDQHAIGLLIYPHQSADVILDRDCCPVCADQHIHLQAHSHRARSTLRHLGKVLCDAFWLPKHADLHMLKLRDKQTGAACKQAASNACTEDS